MSRVEVLLKLQKRAFESSQWHSLKAALDGVDEDVFGWKPLMHEGFPWMDGSIRDIVYHVTGDKLVQLSQAYGDGSMNWKNVPIVKGKIAPMLEEMAAAHEKVIYALRKLNDDGLQEKVATWGGTRMAVEDFFLMLIEHDIYHAGQIRYIRNVAG